MKTALVTGIGGQDGFYLRELLLKKGYKVHGIIRRTSTSSLANTSYSTEGDVENQVKMHYGDMTDLSSLCHIIESVCPDEIYHLACQSEIAVSFSNPISSCDTGALGTLRLLEAVRILRKTIRICQACSSEMYGKNKDELKNEETIFIPASPYAISKLFSFHMANVYRDSYEMFVCSAILFNHESPRRNEFFVTRKITTAVARIHYKKQDKLELGNLNAVKDWGHAKDYVEAMWLMLQQDTPEDFVISTGVSTSVRKFVELCFAKIFFKISWEGSGMDEVGRDQNGVIRVVVNPLYYRKNEANSLKADSSKAKRMLKWNPSYDIKKLVEEMVEYDLAAEQTQFKDSEK